MKQIFTVLFSLLLVYSIALAQESTVNKDSDLLSVQGSSEAVNNGAPTLDSNEAITNDAFGSHILLANPPPANNGGSPGWAMFLDLIAGPRFVTITGMRTASTATAGAGFSIEFFTRSGTALAGQGSSSDGWTSLGTVPVIQGAGGSTGVSELFATPVINLNPGDTVGVAMLFTVVGPRYFGTGAPPLQVFADTNLTLITGEARSAPFTPGGSVFASRGLVGEIHYDEFIPVEFVSFTASVLHLAEGEAIELSWITNSELNNLGFEIERKTTGTDWDNIGFVNGYGTTTETNVYSYIDRNLAPGSYSYRLKQIDLEGSFDYHELAETIEIGSLQTFYLSQNFPNPFNPSTTIKFSIPSSEFVTLKIFDVLGNEIAVLVNEEKPIGTYEITWLAENLPSGFYTYRVQAGDFAESKKMILMK